jgi:hypothetical protein
MTGLEVGADVGVKFDLAIGRVNDNLTRMRNEQKLARRAATPAPIRLIFSATATAAGFALLAASQNSGPDMGYFWEVRSIAVSAPDVSSTIAGSAYVFISAGSPLANASAVSQLNAGDWRDTFATIPGVHFYGRGEMPLRVNEEIFFAVSGVPANQLVVATVQAENYQEAASTEAYGGGII